MMETGNRVSCAAVRQISIAVLPFTVNGPDADYLSEGIVETITNTLSRLPELNVTSSNSVRGYRGREVDAHELGRDLEVDAALLGKIRRAGKDLTINVELVDTRNGRQIWGENFSLNASDLLTVQDRISRGVASLQRFGRALIPEAPASQVEVVCLGVRRSGAGEE
jgi:TolB-like protein